MIRFFLALAMALASSAAFGQVRSEYSNLDFENDCITIARASEPEGYWSDLVCPGYGGYPLVLHYTDARDSVTYGFATGSAMHTFGAFNYANDTVEWRVREAGETERPVAAIQRWYLANPEGEWDRQILVVSRVGQPEEDGDACVIAYIDAGDGAPANVRAREAADSLAEDFACGTDRPLIEDGIADFVPPQG